MKINEAGQEETTTPSHILSCSIISFRTHITNLAPSFSTSVSHKNPGSNTKQIILIAKARIETEHQKTEKAEGKIVEESDGILPYRVAQ